LTAEEEKSLTTHLIDAANLGYGKTREKVNRMAENVAREKGIFHNEKNIQWMVEKIYRATVTLFPTSGRFHSSCPYGCHQLGIYFTIF